MRSLKKALRVNIRDDEWLMHRRLCEKAREAFCLGSISAALSCPVVEKWPAIEPTFSFASLRHFYFSDSGTETSKCYFKNTFKNASARRSGQMFSCRLQKQPTNRCIETFLEDLEI